MIRVLIVDDHAVLRDGLRAVLSAEDGIEVVGEAGDGIAAVQEIVRHKPDVVLLDLNLPLMSGFDLLRELRRRGLTSAVLVLTMNEAPENVRAALELGARGYVKKGSAVTAVISGVRAVHAGRRFLPEQLAGEAVDALLAPPRAQPLDALSARERQVMRLVCEGKSSAEIGRMLNLSAKTVDTYRSRLMGKLGVSDVPALVKLALREGLISFDA
jgi:DNA-binding NarL/FixJ family response regulator